MKKKFSLLLIGIFLLFSKTGFSQAILDPYIKKFLKPRTSHFLLLRRDISIYDIGKKLVEDSRALYYYNPDATIAKIDIYFKNKVKSTRIFLQKNTKLQRVIEYDYANDQRYKLEEDYFYNKDGLVSHIEKYQQNGLKLKNGRRPLLILYSSFSYDDKKRISKVITKSLKKWDYDIPKDSSELPENYLLTPISELANEILEEMIVYTYNGSERYPEKKMLLSGVPGNLMIIHVESISQPSPDEKFSVYFIPGTDFKTEIKRKFHGQRLIYFEKKILYNDRLYQKVTESYNKEYGYIESKIEENFEKRNEEKSNWQFQSDKIAIAPTDNGTKEKAMVPFPVKGFRKTNEIIDQEINLEYDIWGNVTDEKIYLIEKGKKQFLLSHKKFSYRFYRYAKK
jgi:hypothetical protein